MLAEHLRRPPEPLPTVLISLKPHYADLIERGRKSVEFRRRFPRQVDRARAVFYVSAPVQAIALTATIVRVVRHAPAELWRGFAALSGVTRDEFDAYFDNCETGVALLLEAATPIRPPLRLTDPRLAAIAFRPPQSLVLLEPRSTVLTLIDRLSRPI